MKYILYLYSLIIIDDDDDDFVITVLLISYTPRNAVEFISKFSQINSRYCNKIKKLIYIIMIETIDRIAYSSRVEITGPRIGMTTRLDAT